MSLVEAYRQDRIAQRKKTRLTDLVAIGLLLTLFQSFLVAYQAAFVAIFLFFCRA
jgi:hypothetical protein